MWSTEPETISEKENAKGTGPSSGPHSGAQETHAAEPPAAGEESSAPAELLVCHGAKCTCDKAADPSPKELKVLSHNKYVINDNGESKLLATNKENALPNLNFGQCKVPNPNHPVPCTGKYEWKDYYDHVELPGGAYVLTEKSTAICTAKGGNIKIVQHGQQANVTTQEVEKANAGAWAAAGPLVTEEIIQTKEAANQTDEDGASVKSLEPVLYGKDQPLNTPIEFKANFNGNPTDAQKQGVNWIIYDAKGQPMQLRTDAGEKITVTFKEPGTYLIEAYGKKVGDKKVTKPFHIKANEIDTVTTADGSQKVRVGEPIEFRLKSLFPGISLPGNTEAISWTVTKSKGTGVPVLSNLTGPSTQVTCNDDTSYVVTAYFNGVAKQSKVIEALKNGIESVGASKTSGRVKDSIKFTVKDRFRISPARETEKALVKWQCTDAQGKLVAEFSSKNGETIEYVFEQPGEFTIQPFMVQASPKVAVKVTIAMPVLVTAQWEYPEGGAKDKTGWDEPNHAAMVFRSAEGLVFDLEYGYLDKENKPKPLHVITGLKIPESQIVDLKGYDFTPLRSKYGKALQEGTYFYFKVNCQSKDYNIVNTGVLQPQKKLQLVTGEQLVSIEFLKAGKPVMRAEYGDALKCRIRTRNLPVSSARVKILRKERLFGIDGLYPDTSVHDKTYPIVNGGLIQFDFVLDKSWGSSLSDNLHSFYVVVDGVKTKGLNSSLIVYKEAVAANGGKAMAGVNKMPPGQTAGKCFCKDQDLVWGNKITCAERKKVVEVAKNLGIDPNWLMSVMALETSRTFSPSIDNGIGYVGLIQFGAAAAETVGTTQAKLVKMTFVEQMDYVQKFLIGKKDKYKTLADLYLAVLYPTACGHGSEKDYVVLEGKAYRNNPAFFKEDDEFVEKIRKGKKVKVRGPKEGGKTYVWEVALAIQSLYTEGLGLKESTFSCGAVPKPNNDQSGDGVLEEMKKLVDQHIPYSQSGVRDSLSEEGLKKLDCSETVAIYLYKLGVMPTYSALYTGVMTTQSDFRTAIGSTNIDLVAGSTAEDFKPQRGDIFVFRESDGSGHTGIVYEYDAKSDIVTILEAIGSGGAVSESNQVKNGGYAGKGCSRTAKYKRLGGALYGHAGFKGYFRPKNYTKKL
ncbi:plastocyanin [Pedobacter cryoconitis]|uniref:DUF4280 domain-containing protein n=1 Tax=Pedobacter cryoconitis TaxID=188932 RepID=UPI00161386D9|nr:DUF4280 domain-containing protein [Pedobacter cryoconitis]MBB6273768.1 plastocyanin [Pedobacter cryoconitis]